MAPIAECSCCFRAPETGSIAPLPALKLRSPSGRDRERDRRRFAASVHQPSHAPDLADGSRSSCAAARPRSGSSVGPEENYPSGGVPLCDAGSNETLASMEQGDGAVIALTHCISKI